MRISEQVFTGPAGLGSLAELHRSCPFAPPPTTATIVTDASTRGYGAWGGAPNGELEELSGFWAGKHTPGGVNPLELKAVLLYLRANRHQLAGMKVLLRADNTCVMQVVNKHCPRSAAVMAGYRTLYAFLRGHSIAPRAVHIDTVSNWRAGGLSRAEGPTDFGYLPKLLGLAVQRWKQPFTNDRFAPPGHHQELLFNMKWASGGGHPNAWTVTWTGRNWLTPPLDLISDVLKKVRADRAAGVMLAPEWQAQPWWPELQKLTVSSLAARGLSSLVVRHGNNRAVPEVLRNPRWCWRLWLLDAREA